MLIGIIGSIIAALIVKAADKEITALFKTIKKRPYETVVLLCLWIIIAGVWTLAFRQG